MLQTNTPSVTKVLYLHQVSDAGLTCSAPARSVPINCEITTNDSCVILDLDMSSSNYFTAKPKGSAQQSSSAYTPIKKKMGLSADITETHSTELKDYDQWKCIVQSTH